MVMRLRLNSIMVVNFNHEGRPLLLVTYVNDLQNREFVERVRF